LDQTEVQSPGGYQSFSIRPLRAFSRRSMPLVGHLPANPFLTGPKAWLSGFQIPTVPKDCFLLKWSAGWPSCSEEPLNGEETITISPTSKLQLLFRMHRIFTGYSQGRIY